MSKLSFTPPHNDIVETHSKKSRLDFKSNSKPNFMYNLKSKLKAKLRLSLLSLFSLVFIACGGGGGGGSSGSVASSTKSDKIYFIDSPVSGLMYKTQSKNDRTISDGSFTYNKGDTTITFNLGNIELGTIKIKDLNSDNKIFIQDLVGVKRNIVDNAKVLKLARLLQSLDTSKDPNVITLNQNDLDKFKEKKHIDDIDIVKQLQAINKKAKSLDAVKEHLGDTIRKYKIALYNYKPNAKNSSIKTFQNVSVSANFNTSDKNHKYLKYTIESPVSNGKIVIIDDSDNFVYTPKKDYTGKDSFTYKAYDGEKYSNIVTISITIEEQVIQNTADTTAPIKPIIISLDASNSDKIDMVWYSTTDDTTVSDKLVYEVHFSKDENFTVSNGTLKGTFIDAYDSLISELEEDTLYYVKLKVIDENENYSLSDEHHIRTMSSSVVLGSSKVVKSSQLHLESADIKQNTLVFEDSKSARLPNDGDILVGNSNNQFLKKVVSSSKVGNTTTIQTKSVSISEVIQTAQVSSRITLITPNTTSNTQSLNRITRYSLNNKKITTTKWKSNKFSIIDNKQLAKPSGIQKQVVKNGTHIKIDIPSSSNLKVNTGAIIRVDLSTNLTTKAINDGYEIQSIKLKSLKHSDKSSKNKFGATIYRKTTSTKDKYIGYFYWKPSKEHSSKKKYTAKIEVKAKDLECSDLLDFCDTVSETIEFEISVLDDGSIEMRQKEAFNTHSEFTSTMDFDFTPTLFMDYEIKGKKLKKAEIYLKGKLDFNVNSEFKFEANKKVKYKRQFFQKTYTRAYLVGTLPVYQEIILTIDGEITAEAQGAITATSTLTSDFAITLGMKYSDKSGWEDIKNKEFNKDYTATITTEGGVKVDVRLIPNIEIKFYKAASAGLSVEPYLKGDMSASGTAQFNTDFESYDTMALYKLNSLNLSAGLDGKVYADLSIWKVNILHYPSSKEKDAKQTVFNYDFKIFSLPEIELEKSHEDICTLSSVNIKADIKDGANNPFDYTSGQWFVFPKHGASLSSSSGLSTDFTFTKKDKYQVYFIGNSTKLGGTYGKQYEYTIIDTRNCTIEVPDTKAPIFTSSASASVKENQTNAITLKANDTNTGNSNPITYSISEDDSAFFNIDSSSGVLTFKTAPNYESGKTTYTFVAKATDEKGNEATQNVSIIILDVDEAIPDTNPPLITIIGENPTTITQGSTYTDKGASVSDDRDTNIVASISGTVDTATIGDYTITYNAQDKAGNKALVKQRIVKVIAKTTTKDICKVGKTEHGLASMLFNLDETTASYDNPGYVKGSYLFAPYAHLITGIQAHAGIDFRTKDGANAGQHKVYSLSSGEVVKAENDNYGAVGIKTTNKENENIVIFYSHLDSTTLIVGRKVEIGTLIGLSGKKGTKAPHLHLEYRVNYTSNFMLGAKSCSDNDCSIAEIKTLTNDPIELLSLTCTQAITDVPTNLSAVSGDKEVSLSWNAVSGATYNVYYGTNTITDISLASLTKVSNISTNTKTITNLTNDTKYYFVITAVKDNIESLKSTQVNSIPKAVVVSLSNSKLNDTGITWGGDYSSGNNSTCTSNISAPQDCKQGRDKSGSAGFDLTRLDSNGSTHSGSAGFDFTRLDSNGSTHSGSAYSTSPWSCVRDNVTGLVWEVKTNDGSIHDKDNTYRWGGISAIGKNHASKEGTYYDDWNSLVNGANNASLCGFNDWRVPKKEELRSIVHYGTNNPSIDTAYFPNTISSSFWSSSPGSGYSNHSWNVNFSYGYDNDDYGYYVNNYRSIDRAVRLMRGGE